MNFDVKIISRVLTRDFDLSKIYVLTCQYINYESKPIYNNTILKSAYEKKERKFEKKLWRYMIKEVQ